MTLPQSEVKFLIFLFFPILSELSQNCQGCFPGREKTMETKKKRKRNQDRGCHLAAQTYKVFQSPISVLISSAISVFHFPMIQPHWQDFSFQKTHGLSHPNSVSFLMLFIHLKMLPPLFLSHLTKILVKYNLFHEAFSDSPDRICCPFPMYLYCIYKFLPNRDHIMVDNTKCFLGLIELKFSLI